MFIARQPIFNKQLEVYGYELLYRSSYQAAMYDGDSPTRATAVVLGGLFESGIKRIVDDKYALINIDTQFLHADMVELVDSDRLILELLEDIEVDEGLIEIIKKLKEKGYKIALDDFVSSVEDYPLVPLADIIKFDLIATPLDSLAQEVKRAISMGKVLLAEKIEREEEFLKAREMGFQLFQGYFFSKPKIIEKSSDKTSSKALYGSIIAELKKEEPSYQALAEIIEHDANLAYRLMRAVSLRSGEETLYSIKRALTFMGLREIERWINILMLQELGGSKPKELLIISLIRTKFAEGIAMHGKLKNVKFEASIMGLFSTLDALLDQSMEDALKDISLPNSITDALISHKGVLFPVYQLFLAYERGQWDQAIQIASSMGIEEVSLINEYLLAIQWAKDIAQVLEN